MKSSKLFGLREFLVGFTIFPSKAVVVFLILMMLSLLGFLRDSEYLIVFMGWVLVFLLGIPAMVIIVLDKFFLKGAAQ